MIINGLFSSWKEAKSGVPWGSLLGLTLFLMNVNDNLTSDVTIGTTLAMFAVDSKHANKLREIKKRKSKNIFTE